MQIILNEEEIVEILKKHVEERFNYSQPVQNLRRKEPGGTGSGIYFTGHDGFSSPVDVQDVTFIARF